MHSLYINGMAGLVTCNFLSYSFPKTCVNQCNRDGDIYQIILYDYFLMLYIHMYTCKWVTVIDRVAFLLCRQSSNLTVPVPVYFATVRHVPSFVVGFVL